MERFMLKPSAGVPSPVRCTQPARILHAALLLAAALCGSRVRAEQVPETFSYAQQAEENRVRALLELSGVYTVGFTFFLATNRLLPSYDVGYSWPVLRKKLLGEGLELDVNGLNTNFVGHPMGGTMYYTMARSNRLSIAESAAFAFGGSLLWELFGEVREYISINDMIVTPLAGIAIAEPFLQLGAFFDRSSPSLPHRILGVLFAPVKSLNDALDGQTLARASAQDAHGFPAGEYHRFDLRTGAAATTASAVDGLPGKRSFEARLSLASYMVRLPDYDGAGQHTLWFADGNVSSIEVHAGVNGAGLVDLDVHTYVGLAGLYARRARSEGGRGVRGQGTLVAWTVGYQYELHDFDRDRFWPRDRITGVQPLALLLEERVSWDALRWVTHVEAGLGFGGLRPYALRAYRQGGEPVMLTPLVEDNRYCFVRGVHVLAATGLTLAGFELQGSVRYEHYEGIDLPVRTRDDRLLLEGRASVALGDSPGRLGVLLQHRARKGSMGDARAARDDTTLGMELGARY
jgi:hypothetical protein